MIYNHGFMSGYLSVEGNAGICVVRLKTVN
jgi:hypothetical protein